MARAREIISQMVQKVLDTSDVFNRGICCQYDAIVTKCSYQAEDTKELVDLTDYVEYLKVGELLELKVSQINYIYMHILKRIRSENIH